MATVELGPGSAGGPYLAPEIAGRRPLFPAIRWGAVIAGVAVGVSVQLVLSLLGVATGLSVLDVNDPAHVNGAVPLIWAGVSMLIAAFVGGYVASRMSGLKRKTDGVLHGAVSWAVTTLLFATLATSAGGSMLSGIFANVIPAAAKTAVSSSAGGGNTGMAAMLQGRFGNRIDAGTLRRLGDDIQAGRREDAVQLLVNTLNMDPDNARRIIDQALIVTGSPEQATPQGRQAADNALAGASRAAWAVFSAVALSLALGIAGGVLGSLGSRRAPWTHTRVTA